MMRRAGWNYRSSADWMPIVRQLMTPAAATAYALAFWRLGVDLNWTSDFIIGKGLFSRWQVWLALAAATQLAASRIDRARGAGGADQPPAGA